MLPKALALAYCAISALGACSDDHPLPSTPNIDDPPGDDQPSDGQPSDGSNSSDELDSTLTATCATLQGRAIVNENGNLSVAFTTDDGAYTFLGSVQWELPDGFVGALANPEHWDGSSDRHVLAVTSPSYETFGNHCWNGGTPPANTGSAVVQEFRPYDGVVRTTFTNYVLRSCVGGGTCTMNGTIETTAEGVFQ